MKPAIVRAEEAWIAAGSPRSFQADLLMHCVHGFVHCSPECFAMARPVNISRPDPELADIAHKFEITDTWMVWSVAGELSWLLSLLPFWLPHIAFHRSSARRRGPQPLRIYDLHAVQARAHRHLLRPL